MWTRARSWEPGSWPPRTGRPRVLLEDPDGAILAVTESFLSREGFDVATCSGPEEMGRRSCPLVSQGRCELVEEADVVYTSLRWSYPESRDVLQALRARHPRTPVVVEMTQPQVERFRDLLQGCYLVWVPAGREATVAAIRRALAGGVPEGVTEAREPLQNGTLAPGAGGVAPG